jgi:hypothetical protein
MRACVNILVMITTRNRAADLRRTCRVLRELNPAPLEILITADGRMDDTIQMLKGEMLETGSQKVEVGGLRTEVRRCKARDPTTRLQTPGRFQTLNVNS